MTIQWLAFSGRGSNNLHVHQWRLQSINHLSASLYRKTTWIIKIVHKHSLVKTYPEDLLLFLRGRKRHERVDSVTESILRDRQSFRSMLDEFPVQYNIKSYLQRHSYHKRRKKDLAPGDKEFAKHGMAVHLSSASQQWPVFTHVLPEIAFAGHSNSGKSTLVNVLSGFRSKEGPAGVSDRAGWTDQICFYQIGKKPPVLIIADMPGYGHAIATAKDKKEWLTMSRDYLSNRIVLSRCCVLVDSSRGLCKEDKDFLFFLNKINVDWQVLLTKTDLLTVDDLSKSIALTELSLLDILPVGTLESMLWCKDNEVKILNSSKLKHLNHRLVIPVSGRTGAGVDNLWKELLECADITSMKYEEPYTAVKEEFSAFDAMNISIRKSVLTPVKDPRVREHLLANDLRKSKHS